MGVTAPSWSPMMEERTDARAPRTATRRRTPPDMTEQELEQAARDLLNRRLDGVRPLIATHQALAAAEQQLEDAKAAHAKAWQQSLANGWTENELTRDLKITKPVTNRAANRATSSPRRTTRRKTTRVDQAPTLVDEQSE